MLNKNVESIDVKEGKYVLKTKSDEMIFDKLIISTGGKSYPSTGSTGDGYKFAQKMGHKVVETRPSLVPIEVEENWIKDLQGLSLKNVSLSAYAKTKILYEEFGEMIFTHYGISGPIVLSMSNYLHRSSNEKIHLFIDLKPALDDNKLDARILRDFDLYNNKQIKNSLNDLLPQKLIPIVINISQIDPDKTVNQIMKEERTRLLNTIKKFPITFKSFRPIEEAIITSGGISVKDINPSTMESKILPNLYFTGEIIDVDAVTGGFNLQIAYSTGYLAGINV
jgi:predicted Rossmann fold flavoprotein